MKIVVDSGNISDVGKKRTRNEDYFGSYEFNGIKIYIVCDGMGGHTGGEFASRIAVNEIKLHLESLPGNEFNLQSELKNALLRADEAIRTKSIEDPELKTMGSTAVVLALKDGLAFIAHIGDSRVYLLRDGEFNQITKDHSLVQQMVDGGIIDAEQAKTHPSRNVVSRALGPEGKSEPEVQEPFPFYKNDIFLLCTDGLTGLVENDEINQKITALQPQDACIELVKMANDRGGNDNITIQIVKIVKGKMLPLSPEKKKSLIKFSGIGLGVILILLFSFIFADNFSNMFKAENPGKNDSTNTTKTDSITKTDSSSIDTILNKEIINKDNLKTGVQDVIEQETLKKADSLQIKSRER